MFAYNINTRFEIKRVYIRKQPTGESQYCFVGFVFVGFGLERGVYCIHRKRTIITFVSVVCFLILLGDHVASVLAFWAL